jgi:hypothetical protein
VIWVNVSNFFAFLVAAPDEDNVHMLAHIAAFDG